MTDRHNHWMITAVALTALMLALPLGFSKPFTTNDDGDQVPNAANKTAAQGSTLEYLGTAANPLAETTILHSYIKTSGPEDALLSVSLECALWTEVVSTTIEDHDEGLTAFSRAEAHVNVWIEIDGVPVKVANDDEDGKVTFCDRVQEQEISDMDNSTGNWTMRQYLETKSANAFNWIALDLGAGVHLIEVKATIDAQNTEGAFAQGAIGKRTLVVEPVKFPTGTTL